MRRGLVQEGKVASLQDILNEDDEEEDEELLSLQRKQQQRQQEYLSSLRDGTSDPGTARSSTRASRSGSFRMSDTRSRADSATSVFSTTGKV